jgi:hypothetical protein
LNNTTFSCGIDELVSLPFSLRLQNQYGPCRSLSGPDRHRQFGLPHFKRTLRIVPGIAGPSSSIRSAMSGGVVFFFMCQFYLYLLCK